MKRLFLANCIIKIHTVNIIKGSGAQVINFALCLATPSLLKELSVYNDYSLFAEEFI